MRPEDISGLHEPSQSLHHILGEQAHTERFLASWLSIHAGVSSEGQREYARQEVAAQTYLRAYVYRRSENTTPRAPVLLSEEEIDDIEYGD